MKYIKLAWLWLVKSSSDPKKMSLTVKGLLGGAIPFLVLIGVDTSSLPQVVDLLVEVTEQTLIIVSAIIALIGFIRKLVLTFKGENVVISGLKNK